MLRIVSAGWFTASLLAVSATHAASEGDWPCIQRKVGELTAVQMWDGPELDTGAPWRDDPRIVSLAAELAQRRMPLEEAASQIERFAMAAGPGRDARLTALFARVLDRINAERGRLVAGIERYARKQRELAERIKAASLARSAPQGDAARHAAASADVEEQLRWDTRIYDERQAALGYVCESPVLLEQRAFALAREIRNHLE